MNVHFRTPEPSALERVRYRFSPRMILEKLAEALDRSPLPFSVLIILIPSIAVVSALGLCGALGLPFLLAVPVGVIGVFWQASFFAMLRVPTERTVWMFAFLFGITMWNAVSLSAGIVALKPDSMGKQQIERQLIPITVESAERANMLDTLAGRLESLSSYNNDQAAREGGEGDDYAPTCPSSTGPGVGPISTWRKDMANEASLRAQGLRNAAGNARNGAADALRAKATYSVETHDESMIALRSAVEKVSQATSNADLTGLHVYLQALETGINPNGVCPDSPLLRLVRNARAVPVADAFEEITFTPLPIPNEAEAVADLWSQLSSLAQLKDADLSLYGVPLVVAPLVDILYMTMLAKVLPTRLPPDDDELLAEAMGIKGTDHELLDDAMDAVAADPAWAAFANKIEYAGGRWFRVQRLHVALDDWSALIRMRHLARLGKVRDAGTVDGHQIFVFRPTFLRDRFYQLVRRWIAKSRFTVKPAGRVTTEQPQ